MRNLIIITLLLFMTCGYTQSNKFFGPESHETISDSIVNFRKKNKFGVLIGFGSTFWSIKDVDIYDFNGTGEDGFIRGSTINSLPNFNLIFIKNFKKNMLFICPGIRTISAKLKSKIPFHKDLQVNQVQIELPIIYNIKLSKNISMNFGISPKGNIWGNFLGNYNYTNAYLRYSEEGLIHKEKFPSSPDVGYFLDVSNLSSDEIAYEIDLDKPSYDVVEFSLISGVDFILNKKNRINLSYRLDPMHSTHTVRQYRLQSQWNNIAYSEQTNSNLQYFEINYIHLF